MNMFIDGREKGRYGIECSPEYKTLYLAYDGALA